MNAGPSNFGSSREPKRPPQFHLWQLMLLVTLCAVAAGVLRLIPLTMWQPLGAGIFGLGVAAVFFCLLGAPGYFLTYRWTKHRGWSLAAGVISAILLIWAMLPGVTTPRWAARRMQCSNNLKAIGIALHTYHDDYQSLPSAYVSDENGKPIHSWRVLLLPYLDQQDLYKKYDFSEPWDGPNNIKLGPAITAVYQCPEESPQEGGGTVSYLAVVGKGTMWPGQNSIAFNDVKDGTSNTIMVVEVANSGIQGSEPRDLDYSQLAMQVNPPQGGGISSLHGKTWRSDPNCDEILFGDGSVHLLQNDLKPATLKLLLEINDGQPIGDY